jgi:hypothetical protein
MVWSSKSKEEPSMDLHWVVLEAISEWSADTQESTTGAWEFPSGGWIKSRNRPRNAVYR